MVPRGGAFLLTNFLLTIFLLTSEQVHRPTATTQYGRIRGKTVSISISQNEMPIEIYQFTGVPYAQPPIGNLRFRKTRPIKSWESTGVLLDATKMQNPCIQNAPPIADAGTQGEVLGSEDCLYLNIWVPRAALDALRKIPEKVQNPLSVFVFIHGGAFAVGSTMDSAYNGSYLAAYNHIIVVTIQYRLGSLGFAYLGKEEAPGNMGLWDQLEALKWVYENIGSFGGNNREVTIGGQSAGAMSVTLHLLSPYSRRYFHRAIIQSGSVLSPWCVNGPEVALAATDLVFQNVCNRTLFVFLASKMQCLRSANASVFPVADQLPKSWIYEHTLHPVIDGDFIPRDPGLMLLSGEFYKVPILIGATRNEGTLFVTRAQPGPHHHQAFKYLDDNEFYNLTYEHYNSLMHDRFRNYGRQLTTSIKQNQLMIEAIQLHYWPRSHEGAMPRGQEVFRAVAEANGDYAILCPSYVWGNVTAASVGNVFTYYFTHRRFGHRYPEFMGVTHGDELPFVFGHPFAPPSPYLPGFTEKEKQFSLIIMAYWANFIKYANPNDGAYKSASSVGPNHLRTWPPFVGRFCTEQYFELNVETQVQPRSTSAVICGLKKRDCLFWHSYIPKFANAFMVDRSSTNRRFMSLDNSGSSPGKSFIIIIYCYLILSVMANLNTKIEIIYNCPYNYFYPFFQYFSVL